jgi:1,2-diacylglycerol 3-beta-galactosyltransferase
VARPLLFLIADTGGGHRAAAEAVARSIRASGHEEWPIEIVDPFAGSAPRFAQRITSLYGPTIQRAPWLWGGIFHATNSRTVVAALELSALRSVDPGLRRLVRRLDPAVIVSFHPLLNRAAARARQRLGAVMPLLTVVTDLVDIHAFWASPEVDLIVVPSPGGVDRCRRNRVPAGRLVQIGLPVSPDFTAAPLTPAARRQLRIRLGLDPDRFAVLLCSGADGSGGLDRRGRALAAGDLDVSLVVICGRNRAVQRRLRGLRDVHGRAVIVRGFVDNMAEWMTAVDLVVTKAGPATISEALCRGLPLLVSWFLPGQERGNVEWLVDAGAARYVPGAAELVDEVAELATPGSPTLRAMRAAVAGLARPAAAADIARLVVEAATAGTARAGLGAR